MRKIESKKLIREIAKVGGLIIAGTLFMALGTNLFFNPSKMVPGGFTGLAIILEYLTKPLPFGGIPVWLGNIILNVPLILAAIAVRGWTFMRRTFLASLAFSAWLYVLPEFNLVGEDFFLVAIFGGSLMGIGLGLVFLGGATTGGTDTVAALLQKAAPHLSVARIMPLLDGMVIVLSLVVFGVRISLYAIAAVVITGYSADRVISGFRNAVQFYIISSKAEEIAQEIMSSIDRGVTKLYAKGMYTQKERPVLMCVVDKRQTAAMKEVVYGIDPNAFLVLADAQEVRGEGFLQYTKDEL